MENERLSKQLDIHDIRINRILRWTGWGLVIATPIVIVLSILFPEPEPSWAATAIVAPIGIVWMGSMFFYPFFLIYRGLKSWSKKVEQRKFNSAKRKRERYKKSISETKIGPRGGVYTEEVTKDGKPYRNYF